MCQRRGDNPAQPRLEAANLPTAQLQHDCLWVPKSVTSGDLLIFVDQPTEPITLTNPSDTSHSEDNQHLIGWSLAQRAIRSMVAEVIDVLGQHLLQMTPVDDEHPIQTLATHTFHPALSDRIRARSSNRAAQNVDADQLEHRGSGG